MPGEHSSSELKINLWMPFDIGPFLQDTAHLSTEEIGAYTLLLLYYWAHGSLPNDPKRLANIAKMPLDTWSNTHEALSMYFFEGSDGLLHQKGADRRRAQWLDKRLKAREKALKAINARWSKHRAKLASVGNTPSIPEEVRGEIPENYPTSVIQKQKQILTPPHGPQGGLVENKPFPLPDSPTESKSADKAKQAQKGAGTIPASQVGGNVHAVREKGVAVPRISSAGDKNLDTRPKKTAFEEQEEKRENEAKFEVMRFWEAAEIEGWSECPWSVLEGRALGRLLRENPKLDGPGVRQLLINRAASEGINRADPPRKWLRSLMKYADGPLDRFGKPRKGRRKL